MRRLEDNFEFVIVVGIIGVILFVFVLSCFSIFLHHLSIRFNLLVVWIHLFLFEFVSIFFFSCYASVIGSLGVCLYADWAIL